MDGHGKRLEGQQHGNAAVSVIGVTLSVIVQQGRHRRKRETAALVASEGESAVAGRTVCQAFCPPFTREVTGVRPAALCRAAPGVLRPLFRDDQDCTKQYILEPRDCDFRMGPSARGTLGFEAYAHGGSDRRSRQGHPAPTYAAARLTCTAQEQDAAKGNAGGLLYHPVP